MFTSQKFTAKQIKTIAERYAAGEGTTTLGRIYGVSDATIGWHVKRQGVKMRTVAEGTRKLALKHDAFSHITPASAYWVGFLLADGCIVEKNKRISLGAARIDKKHIEKFRDFLGSGHKICFRKPNPKHHIGGNGSFHIEVSSAQIFDDLTSFGISPRKTLNEDVFRLERNRDFWRGYIDGDGSIGLWLSHGKRRKAGIFISGSMKLLKKFQAFVWEKQPECKLTIHQRNKLRLMTLSGKEAVKLIRRLYKDAAVALDRKEKLAAQICQ